MAESEKEMQRFVLLMSLAAVACEGNPARFVAGPLPPNCTAASLPRAVEQFEGAFESAEKARLAFEIINEHRPRALQVLEHSSLWRARWTSPDGRRCQQAIYRQMVPAATLVGDLAIRGIGPNCEDRQHPYAGLAAQILRRALPDLPDPAQIPPGDATLILIIWNFAEFCRSEVLPSDSGQQETLDNCEGLILFAREYEVRKQLRAGGQEAPLHLATLQEDWDNFVRRGQGGRGFTSPFMAEVCRRAIHPDREILTIGNPDTRAAIKGGGCRNYLF